jgi:hypothetical protein
MPTTPITPITPITPALSDEEKRVRAKLEFYAHLLTYLMVTSVLALIDLRTSVNTVWFVWPALGWGVGVVWHGLAVFVLSPSSPTYRRLLDRERRRSAAGGR